MNLGAVPPHRERRSNRGVHIQLGLFTFIFLLGLICGSLVASFYGGFLVGHKTGFEEAMTRSIDMLPRAPIDAERRPVDESVSQRIFDRLRDQPAVPDETPTGVVKVAPLDDAVSVPTRRPEGSTIGSLIAPMEPTVTPLATSAAPVIPTAISTAISTVRPAATSQPRNTPTPRPTATTRVAPTPTPVQRSVGTGWYAQVAAPRVNPEVEALIVKLRASGFAGRIERANLRGQNYFRVLVGPEKTKEQAMRLVEQLKREPYLDASPFLRFIK